MQPRNAHLSVRLEHLATTAGLTLASAGLLTLLLCAAGLRGMDTLFADWALLAGAATPASRCAWRRLAPLFWSPGTRRTHRCRRDDRLSPHRHLQTRRSDTT